MQLIALSDDQVFIEFVVDDERAVRIRKFGGQSVELQGSALPIAEVLTVGTGTGVAGRLDGTPIGVRLRLASHRLGSTPLGTRLELELEDEVTGLAAVVGFETVAGASTIRVTTTLENRSSETHQLLAVSSLALASSDWSADGTTVHYAESEWLAENRWMAGTVRGLGQPAIRAQVHAANLRRGSFSIASHGSWSTGEHLPMGALEQSDGSVVLWQIENNGAWNWRVAETLDGLSVVATGPTDRESGWLWELGPGERFEAPRATMTVSSGGFGGALADLTRYRRATRRPSPTGSTVPVVYNDYMNTLMADPTTEKLLPLIAAVGAVGADVFCIDAGWYADETSWWDTVGEWMPSTTRFSGGLGEVIDAIRDAHLMPGLWLEPEVVGVRSPVAEQLPREAFFLRGGERVVIDGRYHLDLRHPSARAHLDGVVDRLIAEFGIGYFKFDYNVCAVQGTDVAASSPGAGQQLAAEAFLSWTDQLLTRHPRLIVEACASGGMRSDWATMSRFALLSTSDQQDALATVPIAASAATVVPPEQAAVWCYPQPGITEREWSVVMVNGLLSRPHLSGFLDGMSDLELARVSEFLVAYRSISPQILEAVPFWPIGLPSWDDEWVAFGLTCDDGDLLVSVWHRGGELASLDLPIPVQQPAVHVLYPARLEGAAWEAGDHSLRVTLPPDSAISLRVSNLRGIRK